MCRKLSSIMVGVKRFFLSAIPRVARDRIPREDRPNGVRLGPPVAARWLLNGQGISRGSVCSPERCAPGRHALRRIGSCALLSSDVFCFEKILQAANADRGRKPLSQCCPRAISIPAPIVEASPMRHPLEACAVRSSQAPGRRGCRVAFPIADGERRNNESCWPGQLLI